MIKEARGPPDLPATDSQNRPRERNERKPCELKPVQASMNSQTSTGYRDERWPKHGHLNGLSQDRRVQHGPGSDNPVAHPMSTLEPVPLVLDARDEP